MKHVLTAGNRYETRRQSLLQRIAQVGPFVEGCVCSVRRKGCRKPGWHLTFKKGGRTRTLYIPMDMVEEVKGWSREYQQLKKWIRLVTTQSLGLIRRHVANRRAARRSHASTSR